MRGFTQDDAHLFVRPDQLLEEFEKVIDIVLYIFKTLKFDNYTAQISLRDPNNKEKYIGSDENWEKAESAIIQAAKEKGLNTVIEYGEAAFYGPKLDFMVRDAIGRKWQLGTIQVDYNLPERFDLTYKGADDKMHRPIMIHRAPFGSMERFVAVLLEHTGGKFPLWLSPDQVVVLPISEKFNDYAEKVSGLPEQVRHPLAGRRPQREDRPQDPRQRAQAHPLPADRRRKGGSRRTGISSCAGRRRQGTDDPRSVPRLYDRSGQPRDRRQQNGAKKLSIN